EGHVSDNPSQVARLGAIEEEFERWRVALSRADVDPSVAAEAIAIAGELRRAIDDFVRVERTLLEQRLAASERAAAWSRITSFAMPLVAVLIALVSALVVSGRIARRVRALADTAEALASGKSLTVRAATDGSDELAALAQSFNAMADRLLARGRQSALLNELGEGLLSCLTLPEAFAFCGRFMLKSAAATSGRVCVQNASRNLLDQAFSWGTTTSVDESFEPKDCLALRRGSEYLVEDASSDGTCSHVHAREGSVLCVPLMAHGDIVGVFTIAGPRETLTEEAITLFRAMGEQLGLAFANLQLRERLQTQSIRDALTGLFNRRYLEETLPRELARGARANKSIGVLLFDVDHFKTFNDTFGHDAGDAVLRELGGVLRASVRQSDIACRYGGEEFVVVFPEVDLEGLTRRAERLREKVKEIAITHGGRVLGPVSISIGAALSPLHGASADVLLKAADRALYDAKGAGRDRVVTASTIVVTMPLVTVPPRSA
ncbi:MAG: domain S-box/diguanylate cyclase protein, partial [Myxococcaceae bacterium]|nr:domain S-box/diguanylate cyclase protein [Myxococcaceae bacterium]